MMKCKIVFLVIFLFFVLAATSWAGLENVSTKILDRPEYYFYAPEGIENLSACPLIVAMSPSGNAKQLINTWRGIAKENNCCLFASKVIKNGMDVPKYLQRIRTIINSELSSKYPIKKDCIIAVGVSGGGMAAHLFSFFFPDTVAAVISNVGYIHENSLKRKSEYPKGKVCVLLTGPKDFNYKLMKEDRKFLTSLGWTVRWTEFPGGHRQAPIKLLKESIEWILQQDYIKNKLQ